jgi:hypothetical protein
MRAKRQVQAGSSSWSWRRTCCVWLRKPLLRAHGVSRVARQSLMSLTCVNTSCSCDTSGLTDVDSPPAGITDYHSCPWEETAYPAVGSSKLAPLLFSLFRHGRRRKVATQAVSVCTLSPSRPDHESRCPLLLSPSSQSKGPWIACHDM